uniref:54S ribosomal protein L12, mitochondrial n=1 Tax=Anthurium amnicola TaxID=1678845 RepID=A0A1D1Z4Z3_9ARAE
MSSLSRLGRRLLPTKCSTSVRFLRSYSAAAAKEEEEPEEMFDQRRLPVDYDPANFDPTEHRSPPSERVWRLVDEISGLTLVEVAELSGIIMRKLNMKEPPVIGVMKAGAAGGVGVAAAKGAGGAAAGKEEKKPEKTAFELKLESFEAASKIKVIKEVRGFTDLGLKEAKELVEKAPAVIKSGVSKEEAERIVEKMKAVGAKVVME